MSKTSEQKRAEGGDGTMLHHIPFGLFASKDIWSYDGIDDAGPV